MSTYGLGEYGQGEYGRYDAQAVTPGVQTPRAPADVRVRAYDPNGDTVGLLPTPTEIGAQFALNDVGALSLSYPLAAPRAALLGRPMELATEITWDGGQTWHEPPSGRFLYLRDEGDATKPAEAWKITAPGIIKRLEKAHVGFSVLDDQGKRAFDQETPGAILAAVWDSAVARGLLVGMTRSWSTTNDSNGTPWPETQSITYDSSSNLLAILTAMAEQGWLDFRTQGRSVQVYVPDNPDGMGKDQTLGALPVTLRYGRDLMEAPFRRTWEGLADTVLVLGDGGAQVTRTNPNAITPWGPQEQFATASGVSDEGTLNTIGDANLTYTERERVEHTLGLEFAQTPNLPFRDYLPGHWVFASTDSAVEPSRMRLRAITLTRDSAGALGGNVTLNDKFLEADILQNRRIAKLTAGAVQAGTGTTPTGTGNDILAPAKVTGLTAVSAAYVEMDGRIRSQITLNWTDTTTNADGSPASDIDHYEVWARRPGVDDWRLAAETTDSQWFNSPYEPGEVWEFQVRAVDAVFNRGAFSDTKTATTAADMVAPPKPSTPTGTTRLGTARISWDGEDDNGDNMAATVPDFRYVSVHVAQVNGFTPDDSNRVGELSAPGYVVAGPLNYQATYYARLVAYDSSGNASLASAQVVLVVAPLVDVSNFPDDAMEVLYARTAHFINVDADMMQANSVTAMAIEAGAVTAEKLTIGSRGQSILVNGFMEEMEVGSPVGKPAYYGTPWGSASLAGETAAPISGTRSMKITYGDTGGSNVYADLAQFPVVAGQVWYARMVVKAVQASTRNIRVIGHTAMPNNWPLDIFNGNVTWHYLGPTCESNVWAAGQTKVLEGMFTVSAGHVQANVSIRSDGAGAVNDVFLVDSLECWPANTDSQITEVSAGKLKTGIVQATERIVAGSLTGARAELNGVGFQAFNPFGVKMFEVQANSGDTIVGDSGGIHMMLGAYGNIWNGGVSQAIIKFRQGGWNEGKLFAQYWSNIGALRLVSPSVGDEFANSAYLDLRSDTGGNSEFYLRANTANMTANSWIMGGVAPNTVDFRLGGNSTGFTFSDFSGLSRLNLYADVGQFRIRAGTNTGAVQRLNLNVADLQLQMGNESAYFGVANGGLGFKHFGQNVGYTFARGRAIISTYQNDLHAGIEASSFQVNSDPRLKDEAQPVQGALEVVRSIQAYDYKMKGILPRKSTKAADKAARKAAEKGEVLEVKAEAARGLMADELRALLPDAVHENEDGFLSISVYDVTATLWAAVRELSEEVATLKASPKPPKK